MSAIHRADLALIGTAGAAAGLSNAISVAALHSDPATAAGLTVRFLETEVIRFSWHGGMAYLTPTDLIAVASALILMIRFAAWAVAPVCKALKRGHDGKT